MPEKFVQIAYATAFGSDQQYQYLASSEHLIGLTDSGRIFSLNLPNEPDHQRHQWREIKLPDFNS